MPYRLVTRSRKLAGKLTAHALQHGERVADSLQDRYAGRLLPGEILNLEKFQGSAC